MSDQQAQASLNTRRGCEKNGTNIFDDIQSLCSDFRRQLKKGERRRIEDYLGRLDETAHQNLFQNLLHIDLEFRRRKQEDPSPDEYVARFPQFGKLIRQAFFESTIMSREMAKDTPADEQTLVLGIPPAARKLGEYELLRELGRGGFGVVYEARHVHRNDVVALKTLPTALNGQLDEQRLRAAPTQLPQGILALHERGIVHRDLKPNNVLINADGHVVILDFGLVAELQQQTDQTVSMQSQQFAGTPRYAAPEQAEGTRTTATDWYALGVMLYEALTGMAPFQGSAVQDIVKKQTEDAPTLSGNAEVPQDLAELVDQLLQRGWKTSVACCPMRKLSICESTARRITPEPGRPGKGSWSVTTRAHRSEEQPTANLVPRFPPGNPLNCRPARTRRTTQVGSIRFRWACPGRRDNWQATKRCRKNMGSPLRACPGGSDGSFKPHSLPSESQCRRVFSSVYRFHWTLLPVESSLPTGTRPTESLILIRIVSFLREVATQLSILTGASPTEIRHEKMCGTMSAAPENEALN